MWYGMLERMVCRNKAVCLSQYCPAAAYLLLIDKTRTFVVVDGISEADRREAVVYQYFPVIRAHETVAVNG